MRFKVRFVFTIVERWAGPRTSSGWLVGAGKCFYCFLADGASTAKGHFQGIIQNLVAGDRYTVSSPTIREALFSYRRRISRARAYWSTKSAFGCVGSTAASMKSSRFEGPPLEQKFQTRVKGKNWGGFYGSNNVLPEMRKTNAVITIAGRTDLQCISCDDPAVKWAESPLTAPIDDKPSVPQPV